MQERQKHRSAEAGEVRCQQADLLQGQELAVSRPPSAQPAHKPAPPQAAAAAAAYNAARVVLLPARPWLAAARANQSACFLKNAGISISSIPLLASASTLAAVCERALRHTLGVFKPS